MGVRKTGFYKHVLVQNLGLMLGRLVDKCISTMTSQEDVGLEVAHWGRRGPLWLDRQEGARKVATQRRWGVVPEGGHAYHLECRFGAEQDAGL